MSPTRRTVLLLNVALTGVLLGQLQWGVFFMLQSYLASTAVVYLLGTVCWLAGSLIGLIVPGQRGELVWAAGMVAAYCVFAWLAEGHPYQLGWLPVLLLLVGVMGGYAGRFFRYRAGLFRAPKWLFFVENCGFVLGILLTVALLYHAGSSALLAAPLAVAAAVLATAWGLRAARGEDPARASPTASEPLQPAAPE
jgi:hypothetical protein